MGILQTIISPSFEPCMPPPYALLMFERASLLGMPYLKMLYLGLQYDLEVRDGMQSLD